MRSVGHARPLLVTAMILSTIAPTRAQDVRVPPTDTARFETEIVVTPERGETPRTEVPAATVVIDQAALERLPVIHPSEVVSFVPGFNVMQGQFYAGRPVLSARGFFGGGEAEYVLVLVDGGAAGDRETGPADWSLVPHIATR